MNVLIIPAWYPSVASRVAGVFIKDQVEAYAKFKPDSQLAVALWGQGSEKILPKQPIITMKNLFFLLAEMQKGNERIGRYPNIFEHRIPALIAPSRLTGGDSLRLLQRSVMKALVETTRKLGKVDVIHAHVGFPSGILAAELSKKTGIPYIITEHMDPQKYLRKSPLALISAFANAKKVIAVSPFLGKKLEKAFDINFEYIPNMINGEFFSKGKQLKEKKFQLLSLCNLKPEKGLEMALKSVALFINMHPPARKEISYIIGGGGSYSYQRKLKIMARELGIQDVVEFAGVMSRSQALLAYRSATVFLLSSIQETFSVVAAESLACGLPIISTRCGGPEHFLSSKNGIMVPVGDSKEMAKAIEKVYLSPGFFEASKIRETFDKLLSPTDAVDALERIYTSVCLS